MENKKSLEFLKRYYLKFIPALSMIFLISGCMGNKIFNVEHSPSSLPNSSQLPSSAFELSDEDIVLFYERAAIALSWFEGSTMDGIDLREIEGYEIYQDKFDVRVVHPKINNLSTLRDYLLEIFSVEFVDRLFRIYVEGEWFVRFVDIDGKLHTQGASSSNRTDEIRFEIERLSTDTILLSRTEIWHDWNYWPYEWNEDTIIEMFHDKFLIKYYNNKWIFEDFWFLFSPWSPWVQW